MSHPSEPAGIFNAPPPAALICGYHSAFVSHRGTAAPPGVALWSAIARNHEFNCKLWAEEDLARRLDVDDSAIAANKRAIDGFNQRRNDATEVMDELILDYLARYPQKADARVNSETAGSMIDRLSILSLKVHHMRLQTERDDASSEHVAKCSERLAFLVRQRDDLAACLDGLIEECRAGVSTYRIYRQFKMYNDPTLNPYLYRSAAAAKP